MAKDNINIRLIETNFRCGDQHAFKILFDLYQPKLISYINSYTNDLVISEDIVQDSFIKLWNAKDKLEEGKPIAGYLYKIAYNTFINYYRKHQKKSYLLDSLTDEKLSELVENIDDNEKVDRINQILNSLEQLPPRCKEIFKMSKLQGYKYKEIAEELNISVKTVDVQVGKALSILRKEMKKFKSFLLFITTSF